jgi:hypothetical protein
MALFASAVVLGHVSQASAIEIQVSYTAPSSVAMELATAMRHQTGSV